MVDIRDDGLGCEHAEAGFGLRHMKERLDLLGGSLTWGNRGELEPGLRGFYLIVSLPVRGEKGEEHD